MTETPESRSEAWSATAEPEPADVAADDEPVTDMHGVRRLRSENQRLRMRLREAEENRASERESNLARIAEYEKREAERAASSVLVDPADLWIHTTPDEQRNWNDEFGAIIPDVVRDAAEAIAAARPHLARPNTAPPPSSRPIEGLRLRPGATPEAKPKPAPTWAQALRGQ